MRAASSAAFAAAVLGSAGILDSRELGTLKAHPSLWSQHQDPEERDDVDLDVSFHLPVDKVCLLYARSQRAI